MGSRFFDNNGFIYDTHDIELVDYFYYFGVVFSYENGNLRREPGDMAAYFSIFFCLNTSNLVLNKFFCPFYGELVVFMQSYSREMWRQMK